MMISNANSYYVNYGNPQLMPIYWDRYPRQMNYYDQPVNPYPIQEGLFQSQGEVMQGPYYQPYQEKPMTIGIFPGTIMQPYTVQPQSQGIQQFNPFDNPLYPQMKQPPLQQFANPYPKQQFMQKAQPSGFQSVLNQFKTNDGSVDVTKMMNTAGQMVNTVSQMTNVFKGVGSLFKTKV